VSQREQFVRGKTPVPNTSVEHITCYGCGGRGHVQKDCPSPRNMTFQGRTRYPQPGNAYGKYLSGKSKQKLNSVPVVPATRKQKVPLQRQQGVFVPISWITLGLCLICCPSTNASLHNTLSRIGGLVDTEFGVSITPTATAIIAGPPMRVPFVISCQKDYTRRKRTSHIPIVEDPNVQSTSFRHVAPKLLSNRS
jgi:hypothetical protein